MDQASASSAASCARNPVAPRTSSSCSRSADRSQTGVPPPARLGPQSEPHAEPSNRDPSPSSPPSADSRLRAISCRSFTPAKPDNPAASLRDYCSGAYTPEKIKQVVHMTLNEKPPNATHWSLRSMAQAAGISYSSVQRIWQAHGLKPHRIKTFKVSRDKNFAAKVADVVGLYLNPPDKALVLCVDEKSQIQALDRTQPGLPLKKGRAGTMTHDYKRNGTTTLFAALNMLNGKVIGTCMPRHRHREFLRFLKL